MKESERLRAAKAPVPMAAISKILNEVMQMASENGANSISMPDEYVAVAHFVHYPDEYTIEIAESEVN